MACSMGRPATSRWCSILPECSVVAGFGRIEACTLEVSLEGQQLCCIYFKLQAKLREDIPLISGTGQQTNSIDFKGWSNPMKNRTMLLNYIVIASYGSENIPQVGLLLALRKPSSSRNWGSSCWIIIGSAGSSLRKLTEFPSTA